VSAIIPSRDRPRLVIDAMRSALTQDYPNLEVCLVDDGSAPPVELPPELAADPRVLFVRVPQPVGSAAARNVAVAHAKGELLAFLDDDDVWLPEKTARQVDVLVSSPASVGGVECGWDFIDDKGVRFRYVPDTARDLPRLLLERSTIVPSSVMLRRTTFDELRGFDEALLRLHDWDLWLRFADRWQLAILPEVLVRRTGHPERLIAPLELPYLQTMVHRLQPRVDALPVAQRRRVSTHHLLELGRHHGRARHRRSALRVVGRAWRLRPASLRVYGTALAAMVVETPAWRVARRIRRPIRRARAARRTIRVRSW